MTIVMIARENEDPERRSPYEDRQTHRQNQREDGYVKMEAGYGIMLQKANEYLGLPEAGRGRERSPSRGFRGTLSLVLGLFAHLFLHW